MKHSSRRVGPRAWRNPWALVRSSAWTMACLLPILVVGCGGGLDSGGDDGLFGDQEGAAGTLEAEMAEDEGPSEDPTNILDQP